MLIGIHPLLTGGLLAALDGLGHGDSLVIADGNFPARRLGQTWHLPGVSIDDAVSAVLTVFPLDPEESVVLMADATGISPLQSEILAAVNPGECPIELADRYGFYDLAAKAQLIIQTGEQRPFGNVLIRKGGVN